MDKPDSCGACGSANIRRDKLTINAVFGGHIDESGELTQPEFLQPMPITFEVGAWLCDDCEARCPDMEEVNTRIAKELRRAVSELN